MENSVIINGGSALASDHGPFMRASGQVSKDNAQDHPRRSERSVGAGFIGYAPMQVPQLAMLKCCTQINSECIPILEPDDMLVPQFVSYGLTVANVK